MPKTHGRTEATVLAFQREHVFEGVHLARIGLRQAENSTFHTHTSTRDTFFVMAGRLTVDIRVGDAPPSQQYHVLRVGTSDESNMSVRGTTHRVLLYPGDVCVVEPRVVHCAMNLDSDPCHFLCIEGVGEYDFIEVGT
jgi:mannose-6-phosphate isomerase-like protein (cupin superfamily)